MSAVAVANAPIEIADPKAQSAQTMQELLTAGAT